MAGKIETLLAEKKIELPKAAIPVANYVPVVITGNLAFVAGQVTFWNGEVKFVGKLGKEYTVEQCCTIAAESRGHMQASLQACAAR